MGWLEEPSYLHLPGARRHFLDEVGEGFLYGMAFGSAQHSLAGLRHSPNGARLAGGARAVLARAPRVAGSWASFLAVWCVFENATFFARRRDDPWNPIAACAATSALVDLRRGARVAACSALTGAAVVALCEGVLILSDRYVFVPPPPPAVEPPPAVRVSARRPAPAWLHRRPLVPGAAEGHVPKPHGFLGIPPRAPIVKEVPAADLGY